MVIKKVKIHRFWWNDFSQGTQASINRKRTLGKRNRQTVNHSVFDLWSLRVIHSKPAIDNSHHNLLESVICWEFLATQCFTIHFITFIEFFLHKTIFLASSVI